MPLCGLCGELPFQRDPDPHLVLHPLDDLLAGEVRGVDDARVVEVRGSIECLERYHYPADRPESLVPEKDGFDHGADALRYLVQNLDHRFETVHSSY